MINGETVGRQVAVPEEHQKEERPKSVASSTEPRKLAVLSGDSRTPSVVSTAMMVCGNQCFSSSSLA